MRPGWVAKRSQFDSPFPSARAAPSICGAAVATPQRKPRGKFRAGSSASGTSFIIKRREGLREDGPGGRLEEMRLGQIECDTNVRPGGEMTGGLDARDEPVRARVEVDERFRPHQFGYLHGSADPLARACPRGGGEAEHVLRPDAEYRGLVDLRA